MSRAFTALFAVQAIISALITVSWLYSGILTPWGVLAYISAALVVGAYFGVMYERARR